MINKRPKLTTAQNEIFTAMTNFWNKNGYSPSIQELTTELNRKSEVGVYTLVQRLEEKGYITSTHKSKRSTIISGTLPQARKFVTCLPILEYKTANEFLSTDSIKGFYPVPKRYQKYENGYVLLEDSYINHTDRRGILICQEQTKFIEKSAKYWVILYLNQLHLVKLCGDTVIINGEEISVRPYVVAKVRGIIEDL